MTQKSSNWRIENLESESSGSDGDESFHNCNEALDRNLKSMDRGSSGAPSRAQVNQSQVDDDDEAN